jgi:uncharacterized protein with NAD-binding domain and iron-sulfur cluster
MTSLAIVGSGIAGLGLAYYLRNQFDITIYEKNNRVGGHTNTVEVAENEKRIPIDTGFMVFNYQTYPNLIRLFEELKVPVKKTDMSFSVQNLPSQLEFAGASFDRLFGDRRNLFNLVFWKMLSQVDENGDAVCCLAEVGNTFGEKKAYVTKERSAAGFQSRHQKLFYVSPFTELSQDLVFDLHLPCDTLSLSVDTLSGQEKVVSASMRGKRLALTDENLLALTLRYPFAPARVIALIHLHALLLWWKRTPYRRKEEKIEQQVAVMHPHHSLINYWQRKTEYGDTATITN